MSESYNIGSSGSRESDPYLVVRFNEFPVAHEHGFAAEPDESCYTFEGINPQRGPDYGPVAALSAVADKLDLSTVLEELSQ